MMCVSVEKKVRVNVYLQAHSRACACSPSLVFPRSISLSASLSLCLSLSLSLPLSRSVSPSNLPLLIRSHTHINRVYALLTRHQHTIISISPPSLIHAHSESGAGASDSEYYDKKIIILRGLKYPLDIIIIYTYIYSFNIIVYICKYMASECLTSIGWC